MDLQLASAWLNREILGFADIHQFAEQCREAAATHGRESAALILLAQAAASFAERQEGVAVSSEVVREFVARLHQDALQLREAGAASDAQFIACLNSFAERLARDL